MKKKLILSVSIVAAAIIVMWVGIFGIINGGRPTAVVSSGEKSISETQKINENGENAKDPQSNEDEEDTAVSAECSWGLSFGESNKAPAGNATAEYLKQYNAYYIDEKGAETKCIYLTFDAGYENGYTEKILDVLKQEKVPAAFFQV